MSSQDGLNLYLIGLIFVLIPLILWVMSLISALRYPEHRWTASGQSRVAYILLIVLLGLLGSLLYLVLARPKLKAVALPDGGLPPQLAPDGGHVPLDKGPHTVTRPPIPSAAAPPGHARTGSSSSRAAGWLAVATGALLLGGLVLLYLAYPNVAQYQPITVNVLILAEGLVAGTAGMMALRGRSVPLAALLWGALVLDLPWRLLAGSLWPWYLTLPWNMEGGYGLNVDAQGGLPGFGYWMVTVAFLTLVCAVLLATLASARRPKVTQPQP